MTYGFNPLEAPLELGGTHLTPQEFHDSMLEENSVIIDVRNFNETAIGRFQPPGAQNSEIKVGKGRGFCRRCPVLSCPVLSCPVLSCPVLSCPVMSCHVMSVLFV